MKIVANLIWIVSYMLALIMLQVSLSTSLAFVAFGTVFFAVTRIKKRRKPPLLIQSSDIRATVTLSHQANLNGKDEFKDIGNIDAVCPYCKKILEHKPGSKKKCSFCGNFIHVRTRPSDKQRVLVTEAQAEQIEEQWSIVNGTHDAYVDQKRQFADEKAKLAKRFGREPSDNDVRWSQLNEEILKHARMGDWGLFRNTKFEMGVIVRKEGRLNEALRFYLEVCYLDLNGPSNTGGYNDDRELLRQYPPWNPNGSIAELAPGVLECVSKIIEETNLDHDSVEMKFLECTSSLQTSLKLPLSPHNAWPQISQLLFDKSQQR
jgi:hypothetical protein